MENQQPETNQENQNQENQETKPNSKQDKVYKKNKKEIKIFAHLSIFLIIHLFMNRIATKLN